MGGPHPEVRPAEAGGVLSGAGRGAAPVSSGWARRLVAAVALAAAGEGRELRFRFERPVVPGPPVPTAWSPTSPSSPAPSRSTTSRGPGRRARRFRGGLGDCASSTPPPRGPYLLVAPQSRAPEWRPGRLLPIAATKTASGVEIESGFEIDLGRGEGERADGRPAAAHRPAGAVPQAFPVGGGRGPQPLTLLVAEGTLFDLPDERLRLLDVPFPAGAVGDTATCA